MNILFWRRRPSGETVTGEPDRVLVLESEVRFLADHLEAAAVAMAEIRPILTNANLAQCAGALGRLESSLRDRALAARLRADRPTPEAQRTGAANLEEFARKAFETPWKPKRYVPDIPLGAPKS